MSDARDDLAAARARIAALERDNARLLRALAEQRRLADAARLASIAVLEALEPREILDTLLDCLAHLVPFDAGCVLLVDESGAAVMEAGVGYDRFQAGQVVLDTSALPHLKALAEGWRSVRVDDTQDHPGWRRDIELSSDTRCWLGVPLIARGRLVGLFGLDRREPRPFSEDDARLAEQVAAHAALAVANARLVDRLRREAARG